MFDGTNVGAAWDLLTRLADKHDWEVSVDYMPFLSAGERVMVTVSAGHGRFSNCAYTLEAAANAAVALAVKGETE